MLIYFAVTSLLHWDYFLRTRDYFLFNRDGIDQYFSYPDGLNVENLSSMADN